MYPLSPSLSLLYVYIVVQSTLHIKLVAPLPASSICLLTGSTSEVFPQFIFLDIVFAVNSFVFDLKHSACNWIHDAL